MRELCGPRVYVRRKPGAHESRAEFLDGSWRGGSSRRMTGMLRLTERHCRGSIAGVNLGDASVWLGKEERRQWGIFVE